MKTKQTHMLIFLMLAMASTAMAQQWHELHTGVTEDLYGVCCIDANTVFACGENGVILKTTDGGTTWQEKHRYEGMSLFDMRFIDENIGFACGNYGESLAKTTDGGEHWTWIDIQFPEESEHATTKDDFAGNIVRVFPVDADTLYMIRFDGSVAKSVDGGVSASYVLQYITPIIMDWTVSMRLFFEDNVGYVFFNDGQTVVYKTMDYGVTFEPVFAPNYYDFCTIHFFDKDEVGVYYPPMCYPSVENVFFTENGFVSVQTDYSYFNQPIFGDELHFRDSKFNTAEKGCFIAEVLNSIIGEWYYLAATTNDRGLHWNYCNVGNNNKKYLNGVDGVDDIYYIVSEGGTIYSNASANAVQSQVAPLKIGIHPNPGNGLVRIEAPAEDCVVRFYDLQGRLVTAKPFDFNTSVTTDGWSQGIYLWEIWNGTQRQASGKWVKE